MGVFDEADALVEASKAQPAPVDAASLFGPPEPPPPAAPTVVRRGTVLPFTTYSDKSVKFEPLSSGIIGSVLSSAGQAATLPGRVYSGETKIPATFDPKEMDPNAANAVGEAVNFAGAFSGLNPAVRSGDRIIPGMDRVKPDLSLATVPSSKELLAAGGAQRNELRSLPVQYSPSILKTAADQIENDLAEHGLFKNHAKGIFATLGRLRAEPGEGATLTPAGLIAIRDDIAANFGKQDVNQKAVGLAFDRINKLIQNPPAGSVLSGPVEQVGPLFSKANANYAAGKRGEALEDIRRTADLRAASANSGQNLDNSVRSRIASLLLNEKKLRGFDDADVAKLEGVPQGSFAANMMRNSGNLLGGGGGLGAGVTTGLAGGIAHYLGAGPVGSVAIGAAAPATGWLLKGGAARSTANALAEAELATRRRSPLFLENAARQDLIPDSPARDAMARALLQMSTLPQEHLDDPRKRKRDREPLRITVTPRR